MQHRIKLKYVAVVVCATVAMACSEGVQSPASPSAVGQSSAALNADGSNLKVTAPIAVSPLFEATNVAQAPTLAAIGSQGINVSNPGLSYRFQVADSDSFENIVANGMGAVDASGVARFTVAPALGAGRRYTWRVRAELQDA